MTGAAAALMDLFRTYNVSRESMEKLELYVSTLLKWQKSINLIGPSTVDTIWKRHILDGLQLLPLLPTGTRAIADLGSGAGIPGLILGIAGHLEVHLYESNMKKSAFLREAARLTQTDAHIHSIRLETLSQTKDIPTVQCVTSRALAPLPQLLEFAAPLFLKGAIGLFHKGQDVDSELTEATKCWKMLVERHQSVVESDSVILEVKEVMHA